MAKATSVWGIEIGQSALKALRCTRDGDRVVAEAFDYIEYPKLLSQPEADPETLVREALETFVNRNDLKNCKVALSVPGQNGLAKFFKPPPVELKKIRDIVKYEAKQQIPFDLDDVVWDYQLMGGGDISEGFALESEVGLFAMKRDAVYRALKPLQAADVEVDLLQLAPLSIYNMITYDRRLADDIDAPYDSEHPPTSTVVLAMGTDATDLIVTNGYRVWQRSMPLGGNHFTRQLTKDLKLTYAKAEHLKRHAMEADDPKLVFQAMRPVFSDLVTEIQRSMGFFRSLNKNSEIGSLVVLGNSVKLPGLTQYLSKNLAMDVEVMDSFANLTGDEVISAAAFKDHAAAFGPVYGLCLQSLGMGPINTNLVPKEVVKERLIRSKKPWAVAAAAALLMGYAANLLPAGSRWGNLHPTRWDAAMTEAEKTKKTSDDQKKLDSDQMAQVELLQVIGEEVSGSSDRRVLWMELIAALFNSLNRPEDFDLKNMPDPEEVPYNERTTLHIEKIDCKYYEDIDTYLTERILAMYEEDKKTRLDRLGLLVVPEEGEELVEEAADELVADDSSLLDEDNDAWVIQIDGYHFHNADKYAAEGNQREEFVLRTLIHELETGTVELPIDNQGTLGTFTYKELGLSNPFVLSGTYNEKFEIPNPEFTKKYGAAGGGMGGYGGGYGGGEGGYGGGEGGYGGPGMGGPGMGGPGMGGPGMGGPGMGGPGMGGPGMGGPGGAGGGMYGGRGGTSTDEEIPRSFPAPKYSFKVQVVWKQRPLTARLEAQRLKAELEAEEAALNDENLASDLGTANGSQL